MTDLTREQIEALLKRIERQFAIGADNMGDEVVSTLECGSVIRKLLKQAPQFQPVPPSDVVAVPPDFYDLPFETRHKILNHTLTKNVADAAEFYNLIRAAIEAITRLGVKGE